MLGFLDGGHCVNEKSPLRLLLLQDTDFETWMNAILTHKVSIVIQGGREARDLLVQPVIGYNRSSVISIVAHVVFRGQTPENLGRSCVTSGYPVCAHAKCFVRAQFIGNQQGINSTSAKSIGTVHRNVLSSFQVNGLQLVETARALVRLWAFRYSLHSLRVFGEIWGNDWYRMLIYDSWRFSDELKQF